MRFAHPIAAGRPLAVLEGNNVAPLAIERGDTVEIEVEGVGVLANQVRRSTT
jgi:2-keto-4-pentenoate hydratase/2-oxohepta-3-ene-1,7-dioic acid hydratase in catechol pathway